LKQVTQNYRTGRIRVEPVNAPSLRDDGVLVRTVFSVISAGTEGMKVREGKMSLVGKAMARPDQVKKVMRSLRQQGPRATLEKVFSKLDSLTPLGYSLAGTVIAVGRNAGEFQEGDRVACAGAEYAHHGEVVYVPRNLVVKVPETVPLDQAAFATIGAIAMQGFRRGGIELGEVACVVGLGLLGQILVRILRAAGVQAVGVDLSRERCALALLGGAVVAGTPDEPGLPAAIRGVTGGFGADAIFITAGGDTTGPVELAVQVARDRARVVDIGKTRIELSWNDYYMKELDFVFSRSYGPGRYDPTYEERGIDYPIGYVRWTERRNMASFLDLIAQGRLDMGPIITSVHPIAEAEAVYEAIARGEGGLGILFQYPDDVALDRRLPSLAKPRAAAPREAARVGVIGAGNYAISMLLPHLAREPRARLVEVATRSPLSAANAQRRFPFERSSTDSAGLLSARDINAVVIATRHASHAALTAAALLTGRPVFVEKPLAIDRAGVERVRRAVVESGNDRLQVGFNRRFAPLVREVARFFAARAYPLAMVYRVHAGQLDSNSWYLDAAEGSRFAGEGGHFLDVFSFLTGARPVSVSAACVRPSRPSADDRDNLSVTVTYEDGSLGQLLYLTQGGSRVPKEELEVFGGGKTARLHNFAELELLDGDGRRRVRATLDKGQKAEVAAFVEAVVSGGPMPVSIDALLDTTLLTLAAEESLRSGGTVAMAEFWEDAPEG
jgi:predicted dehydrogenase/threonine dehydrogenase-like Zn-dependent dehydrogenase